MKKAGVFLEYVLIVGIVSLALVMMNVYMKRGLQGKIADMSDFFISREHAANSEPTADITANTTNAYSGSTTYDTSSGGGTKLALLDNSNLTSTSRVADFPNISSSESFIPAEQGYITPPERPTGEDSAEVAEVEGENRAAQIRRLEAYRDNLLFEAKILEEKAKIMQKQGYQLLAQAAAMDCEGSRSCRRARRSISAEGSRMLTEAKAMLQQAAAKKAEAAQLQARIDALRSEG